MPRLQRIFALALLLATPLAHADAPEADQQATDPEEQLDDSLKRFGFLSGLTRGCVVPEQRAKIESEAMELSAVIGRLLGTDRAFLYTSGFGYGTSITVKVEECAEVLKQYEARVEKFRAGRGAAK